MSEVRLGKRTKALLEVLWMYIPKPERNGLVKNIGPLVKGNNLFIKAPVSGAK